jgi:hypothetical protein
MRPEDEIGSELKSALAALAEADRGQQAGPEVEARLRAAFRNKQRRTATRNVWPMVWAIAAAALLAVVLWNSRGAQTVDAPQIAQKATPAADKTDVQAPVKHAENVVAVSKPRATRMQRPVQQEIATDFFPLVDFAPPADNGELVRVSLPASAMRQVGLPVREERMADLVQADVVMSNGLATAIRFVRNSE